MAKNEKNEKTGTLYLVATPIGNMEDITFRAVRILKEADLIAAEDTRTSGKLLDHYDISTKVTSYHEHNKISKAPYLLDQLREGKDIAVITDAGTPGISDPGEELVKMAHEESIPVIPVPGPAAFVAAATSSGLPCRRIAFEAFLPKNKKLRKRVLEDLKSETRTIVIYEAPHHLKAALKELYETLGDRQAVLRREITKRFEERIAGSLKELAERFENVEPRGEFVVVINGKTFSEIDSEEADKYKDISAEEHYALVLEEEGNRKAAMKRVASARGISKNELYKLLNK